MGHKYSFPHGSRQIYVGDRHIASIVAPGRQWLAHNGQPTAQTVADDIRDALTGVANAAAAERERLRVALAKRLESHRATADRETQSADAQPASGQRRAAEHRQAAKKALAMAAECAAILDTLLKPEGN